MTDKRRGKQVDRSERAAFNFLAATEAPITIRHVLDGRRPARHARAHRGPTCAYCAPSRPGFRVLVGLRTSCSELPIPPLVPLVRNGASTIKRHLSDKFQRVPYVNVYPPTVLLAKLLQGPLPRCGGAIRSDLSQIKAKSSIIAQRSHG
jgi:hypothetical protein